MRSGPRSQANEARSPLEPGGALRLVGTSTEAGAFEVVEEEDRVVVYAWPGSTVQVFQGETLVNDLNVAVADTLAGMWTREFVGLMFGGPGEPRLRDP